MITAVIVSTVTIESIWPNVKHFITRCDSEISTADDLYPLLLSGERMLVLVVDGLEIKGACIYRVITGFNTKVVITTLGGDEANWNDAITDFARQLVTLGYNRLEVQGRRGWLRSLKEFDEMHTTIGMNL